LFYGIRKSSNTSLFVSLILYATSLVVTSVLYATQKNELSLETARDRLNYRSVLCQNTQCSSGSHVRRNIFKGIVDAGLSYGLQTAASISTLLAVVAIDALSM